MVQTGFKVIFIHRQLYLEDRILGALSYGFFDSLKGSFKEEGSLYTLERPNIGKCKIEGKKCCITPSKEGYTVSYWTKGSKFAHKALHIEDVPGRTKILIHGGCRPEHSEGCIIVAENYNEKTGDLIQKSRGSGARQIVDWFLSGGENTKAILMFVDD